MNTTIPNSHTAGRHVVRLLLTICAALVLACSAQGGDVAPNPGNEPISTRYAALWTDSPGEARIASENSFSAFELENAAYEQQGFRLVDFEVGGFDPNRIFVGLWHEVPAEESDYEPVAALVVDTPLSGLSATVANRAAEGFQLVDLEVYWLADNQAGYLAFAAVFHPGDEQHRYKVGLTAAQLYEAKWQQESKGLRQIDVEVYYQAGVRRYAAVWGAAAPAEPPSALAVELPWQGIVDLSAGGSCDRHLRDLEFIPPAGSDDSDFDDPQGEPDDLQDPSSPGSQPSAEEHEWIAAALWTAPARQETVLFPATWDEVENRLDAPFPGPQPPASQGGLLVDIEILWHVHGEIESSLGANHDGPMMPPTGP